MCIWAIVFQIGGAGFLLLIDTLEERLTKKLADRGQSEERSDNNLDAVQNRLTNYKNTTLPVLKQYDDTGKLVVVSIYVSLLEFSITLLFKVYIFIRISYMVHMLEDFVSSLVVESVNTYCGEFFTVLSPSQYLSVCRDVSKIVRPIAGY